MGYVVTAPLVLAKNEEGGDLYLYQGATVPKGQSDEWIAQHVGMIAETQDTPSEDDGVDGKPSARSGVDAWRAYAISQGVPEEEAASLSKDELRDRFPDE